ncbi:ASCH domain-containing protein [Klebsiella aerogenes]|uniref:hypothetical protein n=1 Tax=Klebsiella aerogenes TaxID=548 RepID=UPI001F40CED8|nr:hypothetical protein [Klebsiella aerogenes]
MKERGMIFNGEMVRAILDGRKTQTRRIMKVQPEPSKSRPGDFWFSSKKLESMVHISDFAPGNSPIADYHLFIQEHCCPFGAVGDRIWVRETWARYNIDQNSHDLAYRATTPADWPEEGRWRPSIHMPRWASRILLEITDVRLERLQDISEADAEAEGITAATSIITPPHAVYRVGYRHLWESLYGEDSWQANPWVWVIKFKRIEETSHD